MHEKSISRIMGDRIEKMSAFELLAEVRGMLTDWRITHPRDARINRAEAVIDSLLSPRNQNQERGA